MIADIPLHWRIDMRLEPLRGIVEAGPITNAAAEEIVDHGLAFTLHLRATDLVVDDRGSGRSSLRRRAGAAPFPLRGPTMEANSD